MDLPSRQRVGGPGGCLRQAAEVMPAVETEEIARPVIEGPVFDAAAIVPFPCPRARAVIVADRFVIIAATAMRNDATEKSADTESDDGGLGIPVPVVMAM